MPACPASGRDLLALDDLRRIDLEALIARAQGMARNWAARRMPQSLHGKRVALVVDDGGWRNTTAFDLGVQAMGGQCVHAPIQLAGREAVADLAAYLDNWVDAIAIRTPDLAALRSFAAAAAAPVINARTRANHPCETLGDLAFVQHLRGSRRARKVGACKVAAVTPDANILRSWIEAAAVLELDVVQVYPAAWHGTGGGVARFRASTDMGELADAEIIITDCWPPDGDAAMLLPYQIAAEHLEAARPDAVFLPCPPVTRGQEVTTDAMAHPKCRSVAAKAFLLHAQNAVLEWVLRIGEGSSASQGGRKEWR